MNLTDPTVASAARAERAARKLALGPGVDMHRVDDLTIPGADGQPLKLRALVPTPQPLGVLVYLHGGGWVFGDIDGSDRLGRELASRSGRTVVAVDYAKAPERPFPAAVDDAWAGFGWAVEHCGSLAAPDTSIAVVGDSAGGNLGLVTALRARDAGISVDRLVLVYPVVDTTSGTFEDGGSMDHFLDAYLPDHADRSDWRAAPILADRFAGLPPVRMLAAERDPLNAQGLEIAERMRSEGVTVVASSYPGTRHGFLSLFREDPQADQAVQDIADFLTAR